MAKEFELKLHMKFSEHISKEELATITENVMDALVHQIESGNGYTDEGTDGYTTDIQVESDSLTKEWSTDFGVQTL